MKVKMRGNKIAIESMTKVRKKQEGSLLHIPDTNDCTGVVKYVGDRYDGDLREGQVVCYGDQRTRVKIVGEELEVMDDSNIFAIVDEGALSEEKNNQDN